MTHVERERGRGRSRGGAPASALAAYMESQGLKRSRQREVVAETFFTMSGHVSVEELVLRARRRDPRVSLATVYRTVKLLVESGAASARQFGDGQTRYEAAAGREHHDHLICTGCGQIQEFADEQIEALQTLVARRHGFEVESHKLELYGKCVRCRRGEHTRDEAKP
ncbi:MAG TPA: transcriptional repressor [Anaeromyxobacteraceae bacterium]|nr:transcriptional repressor [Anaeromyxobacteraceae bacterium]